MVVVGGKLIANYNVVSYFYSDTELLLRAGTIPVPNGLDTQSSCEGVGACFWGGTVNLTTEVRHGTIIMTYYCIPSSHLLLISILH